VIDWKPIATAPMRRPVRVKTLEGRVFTASRDFEAEGEPGESVAWRAVDADFAPPCWSDGVCWASNAECLPSDPPMYWAEIEEVAKLRSCAPQVEKANGR
jgi:hypothetical protein